ncbi:hypothetical protein DPMN_050105 [Dreissena polymorpha]|uniref:Uncharacterized protein n=1 Tax=Dreissena polymorpha TaxID=45954 RepID=A0A9D4CGI3_DREPO|nr:hypothetical protein DPMN_050105 [Dreissena polymorpha]
MRSQIVGTLLWRRANVTLPRHSSSLLQDVPVIEATTSQELIAALSVLLTESGAWFKAIV